MDSHSTNQECLEASVEHIVFHNEDNGFCVLRAKAKGRRDLVTLISNAVNIHAGEYIECIGNWINNKKYGLQFNAKQLKIIMPTTLDGIEKYLASGMVKGIGKYFAKKLTKRFGESIFDVIEKTPKKLLKVEGIGKKRKKLIVESWSEQKAIRDIMVFLQSYGVGTARAVSIYKFYGSNAIEAVKTNPYRLVLDVRGIGFKTADALAIKLGIKHDSMMRAEAGVRYVLQELCNNGHCAAKRDALIKSSVELLNIPEASIKQAIESEIANENLVSDYIDKDNCIFLSSLYQIESAAAHHIIRLNQGSSPWNITNTDKAIKWVEQKTGLILSASQQKAVETVLNNKITVITGGPGVGKTTIVNSIVKIISAKRMKIALCAPTGRAAKRLSETTQMPAKTIHRLLEFSPQTFSFKHSSENPLSTDLVIVDEASMIDIVLMYHLLKAIPTNSALLLVGDVDQLPSVGCGNVLADIINSKIISTVRLTEIFRQASNSKIIINAHRINQGEMPLKNNKESDFYVIYADTPEEIYNKLIHVTTKRIPNRFNCDPVKDIQVLTPMNRGGLGTHSLNAELQKILNGSAEPKINRFGSTFASGDKIIQNVNNYDKEVFNGDIGTIARINLVDNIVYINFYGRTISYFFNELDEISLAYATSIHKSQGSEYPIVVIPLATQHYALLARNLLYTGVTRGKKLVVLIGQKKAIAMAIKNHKAAQRLTKLKERLMNCL